MRGRDTVLTTLIAAVWFMTALLAIALLAAAGVFYLGEWFLAVLVIFLSFAGSLFFLSTAYSVFFGAPFVPTDQRNVDEMLKLAGVKAGEKVVDLGSGDGRIIVAAAKLGARAEGWEISPFLWLASLWRIRRAGVAGLAKAHLGTYWSEKFGDADVVTLFLINTQMKRMEKKLRQELRPGSRVVSYAFKFPGWPLAGKSGTGVYLYRQEAAGDKANNVKDS